MDLHRRKNGHFQQSLHKIAEKINLRWHFYRQVQSFFRSFQPFLDNLALRKSQFLTEQWICWKQAILFSTLKKTKSSRRHIYALLCGQDWARVRLFLNCWDQKVSSGSTVSSMASTKVEKGQIFGHFMPFLVHFCPFLVDLA